MNKVKTIFSFPKNIHQKLTNSSKRSKEAVRNIALSLTAKGVSILSSLLVVPLTIHYVNSTRYGIWLTLSSVISWIAFFDLGLTNGFRNKFAEARTNGDTLLARKYLSTTYFVMGAIVVFLYAALFIANLFVNWSSILHVDQSYAIELRDVFAILSAFFCLNMVFSTFSMMLTADQKIGFSSLIQGLGQLLSLVAIYILTRVSKGSLLHLATYYAGVPCLVMLAASVVGFTATRYRALRPGRKFVDLSLVRQIFSLGLQFFVIYICLLLIFQIMNVVITRELGPVAATQYNIAYKYFHVLYMVMLIIISPFWSAFTDAYTQQDFKWMRSIMRKLEKGWLLCVGAALLMLLISPFFYKIWIGDESVDMSLALSASVMIFILSQILGATYMQMINGVGYVRIQLITYIAFALISLPLMIGSCRLFGVVGIVVIPSIVYLCQALLGRIQLSKIISRTASGIWCK